MPRPIETYLHEFIWLTTTTSDKQHVSKRSCSNEMLWAKLKMYLLLELNRNKVRRGKVKCKVFPEAGMRRPNMP